MTDEGNALKALGATDDELVVGNYIYLFGGRDLSAFPHIGATRAAYRNRDGSKGEFFSKRTNPESAHTAAGRLEVDWEHGQGELDDEVLGYVDWASKRIDDKGVFVKRILDRRKAYVKWLEELIRAGLVGTSSQADPAGVRKAANGEILEWPLYRDTLSMTPYEPRMLGENVVSAMKALGITLAPDPATAENESEQNSPVSPEPETVNLPATSTVKGLTEMEEKDLIAVLDARDAAKAAKEQAEATAKAARAEELKTAIAEERKKWEAEAKSMRRGSYATGNKAPAHNKGDQGDSFGNAFKAWLNGDRGALDISEETEGQFKGMESFTLMPTEAEEQAIKAMQSARLPYLKASNATDMNIGTAADGGNLVPTGFYPQIIARRDETMLRDRLGVRMIPGTGTTVDVPVDNEADGEFVSKAEAQDFDLDAPAVDKKSMTLVKYTKYTDVSYELLEDTPTALEAFLADFVGRGMAKTHNSLLLTEVASGGTSFDEFAAAAAIAFGEPENIVGNNDLAAYLEEDGSIGWVMRPSTHWALKSIVGDNRQYAVQTSGGSNRELLGYPVYYSQKAAAPAASAKSIYFGNWRYVGNREAPGITFLRDPYTVAIKGQVRLLWHFRTVYKTLQAEAIGYGVHPSA